MPIFQVFFSFFSFFFFFVIMLSFFQIQKALCSVSYEENKMYKSKYPTARFTSSWEKIKPPEIIGKAPLT